MPNVDLYKAIRFASLAETLRLAAESLKPVPVYISEWRTSDPEDATLKPQEPHRAAA